MTDRVDNVWPDGSSGAARSLRPVSGTTEPAGIARRLGRWLTDWGPALPLIVLAALLLVAPALVLIVESFTDKSGAFTLVNWSKSFLSVATLRAIGHSITLAATVASLVTIVGAPLAFTISRMSDRWRILQIGLLNVASNLSGIGLGFAFVATLGTYGMVTLALGRLGIVIAPPDQGGFWGLVIAYMFSNLPLFVLLALPAMGVLRREWWEAAETSSASRRQFWRYVGGPILAPFMLADWVLIFTWSVGMYGLPVAMMGQRPGTYSLITVEMSRSMMGSLFGARTMPVYAVVLMVMAMVSLMIYRLFIKWGTRWLR